ncbi:MAG: septum formation initiator family protein [Candidatus Omnitrophota bacterium]|nr:septum formation initiator family protein [Candidatus Omnitrophota bacterium]
MSRKYLLLVVVTAAVLLFFWVYFPALSRYREIMMQEDAILTELEDLNQKIDDLMRERDLMRNDVAHLTKVIREELGLVKPGEVVYKVVVEAPESQAGVAETLPGP